MTQDELLQLIDQAAAEGWTELDLAGKGLTELPPEIGKLTQLEVLTLGKWIEKENKTIGNRLTSLPQEIAALENLRELSLVDNAFDVFPEEACNISSLTKLDFSKNLIIY